MALREVKCLRKMSHPCIVKLKEVIRENDELFLVFEYMDGNLYQMMKEQTGLLPEATIRSYAYQTALALSYMHKHGYFHRDLKPENLLICGDRVKLADFGLAREIRSRPPYTDYVSTRWYRAPELLLQSTAYNSPVDIWAFGAILAELYTLRPLFPGSTEADMLLQVSSVLGTATEALWPEGNLLAARNGIKLPQYAVTPLEKLIPNASPYGLALLKMTLVWDPSQRITAAIMCMVPFFAHFSSELPNDLNGSSAGPRQNNKQPPALPTVSSSSSTGKSGDKTVPSIGPGGVCLPLIRDPPTTGESRQSTAVERARQEARSIQSGKLSARRPAYQTVAQVTTPSLGLSSRGFAAKLGTAAAGTAPLSSRGGTSARLPAEVGMASSAALPEMRQPSIPGFSNAALQPRQGGERANYFGAQARSILAPPV